VKTIVLATFTLFASAGLSFAETSIEMKEIDVDILGDGTAILIADDNVN
jgi:hypothetical protein